MAFPVDSFMAFSRFKIQVVGNYRIFSLCLLQLLISKVIMEFLMYNVCDLQVFNRKMALMRVLKQDVNNALYDCIFALFFQQPKSLLGLLVRPESQVQDEMDETQAAVRQRLDKELIRLFNMLLVCSVSVTDRYSANGPACVILPGDHNSYCC